MMNNELNRQQYLQFDPPLLDFGTIPISERPRSISTTVTNVSNYNIILKFGSISNDSIWFTNEAKITDDQRSSGFDIFHFTKRISDITLSPNQTLKVSCSVISSKLGQRTLPLKMPLPFFIFDSEIDKNDKILKSKESDNFNSDKNVKPEKNDKTEKTDKNNDFLSNDDESFKGMGEFELTISAVVSVIQFKVSPKILFLDDCSTNSPQMAKFSIKNTSKFTLSIVIYPPPFIQIKTPKFPNFVKIKPCETIQLSLVHTPPEVGQFDHKISFDCVDSLNPPTILHLMTSVSPTDVPNNFPTFNVTGSFLNFGEIHSGQISEKSFVIRNDSEMAYDLTIAGIIDIFSPIINNFDSNNNSSISNKENSFKSHVLNEQLKIGSSKELKFKTLLSAQYDSKLLISLQSHSSVTIFVGYTPAFNLSVNSNVFDRRKFMITFVFNGTEIYYRHIKCRALVCNSQITIEPPVIDFGDTIVGKTTKTGNVQIINISPLQTTVKIKSSMKALVIAPNQVEVPARSKVNYSFSFYPRKVNPDFSGIITFSNVNNTSNEVRLTVNAVVVATQSESIHSMSYSISSGGRHVSYLDFSFVPQNFPAARSFVLKNRTKELLSINFTSSSPDELFLYYDEGEANMPNSSSNPSLSTTISNSSATTVDNNNNNNNVGSIDNVNNANNNNVVLLSPDSPIRPISDLAEYTNKFSGFYESQYVMCGKYTDEQIVNHFETLLNQFKENINNNLTNVESSQIELPPLSQIELCVVLIPKGDLTFLWKRRQLEFTISLNNITDSIRSFPIVFNSAESISFLSSHSLNFGTLQANTHCEYSLNLVNESSLPLLFRLKAENPVNFEDKNFGIICPFSAKTIPFSLTPKIDGVLKSSIIIDNILNINEERHVQLKGKIVRRSNFVIDPTEIDFGEVIAGSSSPKFLIFVTNTSSVENEITFSNVQKDNDVTLVRPLISYQFKDTKTRLLTDKVKLQIEKLSCKLRCLERKQKWLYAEQIKKVIDELSITAVESTSLQLKQLGAKYMDRVVYKADPLQLNCIEVQMIPTMTSKKPLKTAETIDGMIMIYERGRVDTQKIVKYKARVLPRTRVHLFDSMVRAGLTVEPTAIKIDHIFVQEMGRISLRLKNVENSEENFWILSNSSDSAIITAQTNEGKLKPGESLDIPIDVFCLKPGMITKTITVTSPTSWREVPITINAEFRPVLQISCSEIDFGQIQLATLQAIEKRTAMTITNVSDMPLFVVLSHNMPFLSVYENDPEEPQFRPLRINVQSSITINFLFEPQLEIELYNKYKTLILDSILEVKAYDIAEEAENSLNVTTVSPYFAGKVPILGRIGRVGLRTNVKSIDFGNLVTQEDVEKKISIKNRSSKLTLDVTAMPTQGIFVEPSTFSLKGHQEIELSVKLHPSSWGTNEGLIYFNTQQNTTQQLQQQFSEQLQGKQAQQQQNQSYTKKISVISFVDPKIVEVDLDKDNKNISSIVVGPLYIQPNGTPIPTRISMNIRNIARYSVTVMITEIERKYTIRPKSETSIGFSFPFKSFNPLLLYNSINSNNNNAGNIVSSINNVNNSGPANITNSGKDLNNNGNNPILISGSNSFTYKLEFTSAATQKVIKVIEISGEFVVSFSALKKETISLGRFGSFNDWVVDPNYVSAAVIQNLSSIGLVMTANSPSRLFNIAKKSIGPIPPNSEYVFKVEPIFEKMKELEGPQQDVIEFVNANNTENKLKLTVSYDVRDSFIQLNHVVRIKSNEYKLVKLNKFMEIILNIDEEEEELELDKVSSSLSAPPTTIQQLSNTSNSSSTTSNNNNSNIASSSTSASSPLAAKASTNSSSNNNNNDNNNETNNKNSTNNEPNNNPSTNNSDPNNKSTNNSNNNNSNVDNNNNNNNINNVTNAASTTLAPVNSNNNVQQSSGVSVEGGVQQPSTLGQSSSVIRTVWVATSWFSMLNLLEDEVSASVEIEEVLSNYVRIELFQRKTEIKLNTFEMQPNEAFEIRVKATKLKRKWTADKETLLANLKFKVENSPDISVAVMFCPNEEEKA